MESFEKVDSTLVLKLGISPKECDIAITSIDHAGTLGSLNEFVLNEYGYSTEDLPDKQQLENGFGVVSNSTKKPILFVVTVNGGSTTANIESNLLATLRQFRGWISGKKVWIPLMGTGTGGLAFEESYIITIKTINEFLNNYEIRTSFFISIPDTLEGRLLFNKYTNNAYDKLANEFTGDVYLVGSLWDNEDQLSLFLEKGIWQSDLKSQKYNNLINQVKKGDILIIKSSYFSTGEYYLKIKALGVVTENPKNGVLCFVDWRVKDTAFDVEVSRPYRNPIHKILLPDTDIILSKLDITSLQRLFHSLIVNGNKERIAGLISDTDSGVDYLGIAKDVRAFARVISAKSFQPPLAIALFGKWGSGKSFFMRKLKAQIINLSSNNGNGTYCEGVAQIHFNAWSYMDSNLWASIVTKIFEELNEYISKNKKEDIAKEEIEKQLVDELSITKDEITILENKKNVVESQIHSLEAKKKTVKDELNGKINRLKTETAWKVIEEVDKEFNAREKILAALNTNNSYSQTKTKLKNIVPEEYWNNPDKAYRVAKSRYAFIEQFFKKDKLSYNIAVYLCIMAIVLFSPGLIALFSDKISKINFVIPQAAFSVLITGMAILKRVKFVCAKIKPIITTLWNIKELHEKQLEEALSKYRQEEKALNIEIVESKSEVLLIDEQLHKAETIKADLEYRINNAFATEALYSFIDKRSKSDDYKKHLGIISVIRRDFEILNSLFIGHNEESKKIGNAAEFKSKFKRPLERIVLYIDDLDRCPEENVVQVLEAVNLLMAFPLFVVVVGVDSRWVKNALMKKHTLQFYGSNRDNNVVINDSEIIEPSSYLEKIFQIPFHLKEAKDMDVKDMIIKLAQNRVSAININQSNNSEENFEVDKNLILGNENAESNISKSSAVNSDLNDFSEHSNDIHHNGTAEALIFTVKEIDFMQEMSIIIGNNPRAIKRFVNIYRIIKAHEEFNYEADADQELVSILFLLAIPLGKFKNLLPSIEDFIKSNYDTPKKLSSYLHSEYKINDFDNLKSRLSDLLSINDNFTLLQNTSTKIINKHSDFIRRFTFNSI